MARLSLKDIMQEDEAVSAIPVADKFVKTTIISEPAAPAQAPETDKKVNPKADYLKLSATVPPDMYDQVNDELLRRRKQKKPATVSDIVREALSFYFNNNIL